MRASETGAALVTVYANGRLESAAYHEHDGGEAYMVPLLRQAVRYAKTHYDDGDILQILLSEGEMQCVPTENLKAFIRDTDVRHVYTVAYRWNAETGKKTYLAAANHLSEKTRLTDVPATVDAGSWKTTIPGNVIPLTRKRT